MATPRPRHELEKKYKTLIESIAELARLYHLTSKTISKWKKTTTVNGGLSGGNRTSRSLTKEQK